MNPDVLVGHSEINKRGLIAARNFKPNEIVLNWRDHVRFAIFLNHSCLPSCYTTEFSKTDWIDDILYSGPDGLKIGQEITFDYRKTRWYFLWEQTVAGQCGCQLCIGA